MSITPEQVKAIGAAFDRMENAVIDTLDRQMLALEHLGHEITESLHSQVQPLIEWWEGLTPAERWQIRQAARKPRQELAREIYEAAGIQYRPDAPVPWR